MFSLALYRDGNPTTGVPAPVLLTGSDTQMKTTMMFRNTANPRRTTLAHLADAEALSTAANLAAVERPEHPVTLPNRTANPRRTTLMDAPAPHGVPEDLEIPAAP